MEKFILRKKDCTLVIVDVQEKLAAVMGKRQKTVANCLHLLECAKLLGLNTIITEQYPKGLGPTVREIGQAAPYLKVIEKITFDCCAEPYFMEALERTGKKKVILAGMEAHICVLQTCLGMLAAGYAVHVVSDAVCSRDDENGLKAMDFLRQAGAVVTCTETALFQLLGRAGTPEFKQISARIK